MINIRSQVLNDQASRGMHILSQLVTDLLDDFPHIAIDLNLDSKAEVSPSEGKRVLQHLISAGYTITQDGGATDCVLVTH